MLYYYNADNSLQYKHDAKGQDTVYTYDAKRRVTMIQRYPTGKSHAEDTCERVTYTYDTNGVNGSFSQYGQGRLTTAQYMACAPGYMRPVTEMYSYHPAGAVTAKQMFFCLYAGSQSCTALEGDYTYDTAGREATYGTQVFNGLTNNPMVFTYSYDSMGRPASVTDNLGAYSDYGVNRVWAQNGQYDFAGRMSRLDTLVSVNSSTGQDFFATETRTWNVNGQLASQNWGTSGIQYNYSATQNNGQISGVVDALSGETITYQYDALKRLTQASFDAERGEYACRLESRLSVRRVRQSDGKNAEWDDDSPGGGRDDEPAGECGIRCEREHVVGSGSDAGV